MGGGQTRNMKSSFQSPRSGPRGGTLWKIIEEIQLNGTHHVSHDRKNSSASIKKKVFKKRRLERGVTSISRGTHVEEETAGSRMWK